MTDITNYSDNELSLLVFNTASLYEDRHTILNLIIQASYIYTDKQYKVLQDDLKEDLKELTK